MFVLGLAAGLLPRDELGRAMVSMAAQGVIGILIEVDRLNQLESDSERLFKKGQIGK